MKRNTNILAGLVCCALFLFSPAIVKASERFGIFPSVAFQAMYDSNLFLTSTSEEADFILILTPRLESRFLLRFGEFTTNYQLDFSLPTGNFDADGIEMLRHQGEMRLLTHVTGRIDWEVYETYQAVAADITRPDYQISNIFHVNTFGSAVHYLLPFSPRTQASINLMGERDWVVNFPSDRYSYRGHVDLIHELTRRYLMGFRGGVGYLDFDSAALQDAIIYLAELRGEYQLTDRLLLKVPVGVQYLDQSTSGGDFAGSVDIELNGELTARSTMKLAYKQGFSVDARGNAFDRWEASAGYGYELNNRTQLQLSSRYFNFNLVSLGAEDDAYLESEVRTSYAVNAKTEAWVAARTFFNRGDLADNDADLYQIFLGIRYEFNKEKK